MMMESAPDTTAMEDARQLSIKAAQEVVARRYPSSWGVGAAADQLQRELSSRSTIVAAEFAATKRSQGGVDVRQAEAAKAQTAAMEAAIYGRGGRSASSFTPVPVPASSGTDVLIQSGQKTVGEPSRQEILSRLQDSREVRRTTGGAIPGGVSVNDRQRDSTAVQPPGGNDFPDFGASGGRQMSVPVLGNGGVRGGSASGYGAKPNLTAEEQNLLGVQRLGTANSKVAGALEARGAADPTMSSGIYIPGGINRPYAVRNAPGQRAAKAAGAPAPASTRSQGGGTASSTRSGGSEMIRFSWMDAKQGPGASSERSQSSRISGPVIIDGRTGQASSARSGSSGSN
jgi:hypothetical protein